MKNSFDLELLQALREHLNAHPQAEGPDVVKFVFQGMLGPGHLMTDPDRVLTYVRQEMENVGVCEDEPLTECLSPEWVRLNLRRAGAEGLAPEWIARMMLEGPDVRFTRQDVQSFLTEHAGELSIFPNLPGQMPEADSLPSHTEMYRSAYRPAYRVISTVWLRFLPALCALGRQGKGWKIITMDGPCASGKSTLAEQLGKVIGASLVHTDDFVVPHARKTPERLAVPGGNCDWERLTAEVLRPYRQTGRCQVIRYDFRRDCLCPPEPLESPCLLLEGSYCNLPAIRDLADVRIFVETSEATRMSRLEARESPESLRGFFNRWIPLEDAYFSFYQLPDAGCLVMTGEDG